MRSKVLRPSSSSSIHTHSDPVCLCRVTHYRPIVVLTYIDTMVKAQVLLFFICSSFFAHTILSLLRGQYRWNQFIVFVWPTGYSPAANLPHCALIFPENRRLAENGDGCKPRVSPPLTRQGPPPKQQNKPPQPSHARSLPPAPPPAASSSTTSTRTSTLKGGRATKPKPVAEQPFKPGNNLPTVPHSIRRTMSDTSCNRPHISKFYNLYRTVNHENRFDLLAEENSDNDSLSSWCLIGNDWRFGSIPLMTFCSLLAGVGFLLITAKGLKFLELWLRRLKTLIHWLEVCQFKYELDELITL